MHISHFIFSGTTTFVIYLVFSMLSFITLFSTEDTFPMSNFSHLSSLMLLLNFCSSFTIFSPLCILSHLSTLHTSSLFICKFLILFLSSPFFFVQPLITSFILMQSYFFHFTIHCNHLYSYL